jgi:MAE_28990/MAE_18760-like HEPN
MKLRTSEQALDAIDKEMAWRKKELNNLYNAVLSGRNGFRDNVSRAAFMLVYAHWEGGVKNSATHYLDFVTRQKHSYGELRTNFVAIACANSIQQAAASGKLQQYSQVVDFLVFNQAERFQRSRLFEIQTESNLSSSVMDSICFNVGIALGAEFELSRQFIDRSLLKTRNLIAHGSSEPVGVPLLKEARDRVVILLDMFSDQLQNAITQKTYLRRP